MTVVHILSLSAIGGVQNSFIPYIKLAKLKSNLNHEICLTRKLGDDFNKSELEIIIFKIGKGDFKINLQIISEKIYNSFYNSGSKSIYNLLKFLPVSKIISMKGVVHGIQLLQFEYFVNNAKLRKKLFQIQKQQNIF